MPSFVVRCMLKVLIFAFSVSSLKAAEPTPAEITEKTLGTIQTNSSTVLRWVYGGPGLKHVASYYEGKFELSPERRRLLEKEIDGWLSGKGGLSLSLRGTGSAPKDALVTVDGQPHFPIWAARDERFSPDGNRFAYVLVNLEEEEQRLGAQTVAVKRRDFAVVVDGTPQSRVYSSYNDRPTALLHDTIDGLRFSPDSSSWSCVAAKSEKPPKQYAVVVNGREERVIPNRPSHFEFAPNGSDYAFTYSMSAVTNTRFMNEFVCHRDRTLGPYDSVEAPQFTRDGKHFAFLATSTNQQYLVFDEQAEAIGEGNSALWLVLNNDGSTRVYAARRKRSFQIVRNGEPGKTYSSVSKAILSPDGKRVAYVGRNKQGERLVVDAKEWPVSGRIEGEPLFSADSQHVACKASSRDRSRQHRECLVLDGNLLDFYAEIGELQFSPDGKRLVFFARKASGKVVLVDGGNERPIASDGMGQKIIFSPDGKRMAAQIVLPHGKGSVCMVDGNLQPRFTEMQSLTWSPDSRHVAYLVKDEAKAFELRKEYIVVDGQVRSQYDRIVRAAERPFFIERDGGRPFWFEGTNELHFGALRGDKILSVAEVLR